MAAGSIVVDLLMRTGSFETDTKRASSAAKKAAKEIDATFTALGRNIAIGFTAAQTALTALVVKTTQTAQQIDRFSKLANTNAESFQAMAFGASQYGVQQEKLADILKDVQDKVGDFLQTGAGPMADFFEKIAPQVGVTAEQFRKLGGAEALQLYVSSLEKANLSQSEMTFYMEAIASDATLLLPLLQNNGKAMQQFGEQAKQTGQIMSNDLVQNSILFQQTLNELFGILRGIGNMIVSAVLPSLQRFADELIAGTMATNGLLDALRVLGFAKPFDDAGKGAKYYREELDRLKAARDRLIQQEGVLANTAGFDRDIELAQKRLAYFNALQLRQVNRSIGTGDQSGAEARRLGLTGPAMTALPAPSNVKTGKSISAKSGVQDPEYDSWMRMMQGYEDMREAQIQAGIRATEELKKQDQEYADWMQQMREGELDRYGDILDKRFVEDQKALEKTNDFAKDLGLTFTSAFEDAIVGGKGLRDVLSGLEQDLIRLITRKLITEPLGNMFTNFLGSVIPGMPFGGARAGGGDVIGGRAYLVGENGPEMFMPRTNGTVLPNSAQQPQKAGNVINVNVTAVQGMTRDTALQQGQRIAQGLQLAMMRNG